MFENEVLHKKRIYLYYDAKTKVLLESFFWEFCKITSKRKRPYGDLYKMTILDELSNTF